MERFLNRNRAAVKAKEVSIDFSAYKRQQLSEAGQAPQLVLVSCSDSRVIPEVIFNCEMGDILVSRGVGNTVGQSQYATIYYGVFDLGIRTIAVLGHSGCGAVSAALKGNQDPHLAIAVEAITRGIDPNLTQLPQTKEAVAQAAKENVLSQVKWLNKQENLAALVATGQLSIHGLYYDQETGLVEELFNRN
ncbi:carbonic anhydrase [Gleimia sp. 6138-11-ORH1]|uniref:carbonic anhydrase n=1 Tax=Gleimia sp. 6138-11-ORH1 TaxID=2973937 RepID=UPI00216843E9|nr:carbonic anhydrase [Gleimia sp. 6138-11-ORH1]MCS4484185.1 carbonic anhydrase [Gleimia sp. 6138-11-ORH1]